MSMGDTDWRPGPRQAIPEIPALGHSIAPEEKARLAQEGPGAVRATSAEEGGYKADEDKIRIELIAPEFIFGTAEVLTFGAKKYTARNWERGMHWSRPFGAAMRHLWAWWGGKGPTPKSYLFGDLDGETKLSHLKHAACCLCFLVTYEERGMTQFDDRLTADLNTIDRAKPREN